ncbi:hypothetical protein N182_38015 [Sinorhizobium sp. GL2]|nr:hypothetical protein N182_38015 [Sinorhizobium sp. GL2]
MQPRYLAHDLLPRCGDVAIDDIAPHFRFEECKQKDYLWASSMCSGVQIWL